MIIAFYRYLVIDRKVYMIERPRHEKKLPAVLSVEEVTRAIQSVKNIKHKAIIKITYSGGLRISEVINLKIKDIDTRRM